MRDAGKTALFGLLCLIWGSTWDATTVSFFAVFTPAIAIVLGAVVLGERLTIWSVAGAALILFGVSMTLFTSRPPRSPAPVTTP